MHDREEALKLFRERIDKLQDDFIELEDRFCHATEWENMTPFEDALDTVGGALDELIHAVDEAIAVDAPPPPVRQSPGLAESVKAGISDPDAPVKLSKVRVCHGDAATEYAPLLSAAAIAEADARDHAWVETEYSNGTYSVWTKTRSGRVGRSWVAPNRAGSAA